MHSSLISSTYNILYLLQFVNGRTRDKVSREIYLVKFKITANQLYNVSHKIISSPKKAVNFGKSSSHLTQYGHE